VKTLVLKPGRDKSVKNHHPWIFRGAIDRIEGDPESGETVRIVSADKTEWGRGAYSPRSQIAVRMWSFASGEEIDGAFFRRRIERAMRLREKYAANPDITAHRLVHAESDGIPGLHVDRYGEFLVMQFLAAGVERWRTEITDALQEMVRPRGILERSDVDVREKEGLEPRYGVLAGDVPPDPVEIQEGSCRFLVDIHEGHKTGFYLDQMENRLRMADFAAGREVLNAFAYTGGFGIHALAAGAAKVTNVETSRGALELAARNRELNGIDSVRMENVEGDVFKVLRQFRDAARTFDVIVLDPPKFADSKANLDKAARGYKDINLLAFKLLRPGGTLVTFSCSGLLEPALFQKIVADAALDAKREGRIVARLAQSADHPTALAFPEGSYLKGLVVRVDER
jgi:23S rRNA (cytosine1962-C5)-methyltransferase